MDANGIRFGGAGDPPPGQAPMGAPPHGATRRPAQLASAPTPGGGELVRLSERASAGRWSSVSLFSGALAVGLVSAAILTAVAAIDIAASLGAPALVGVSLGGWLLARTRRRLDADRDRRASALTSERTERLLAHIEDARALRTFEELRTGLGWTDAALAPTLADAVSEGFVEEELDPETGEWVYSRAARLLLEGDAGRPLTASERAAALRGEIQR